MRDLPEQIIEEIQSIRAGMLRSANRHSAPSPATKLDMNDFRNSCIVCQVAIRQLHEFSKAAITENLWGIISLLGDGLKVLQADVLRLNEGYQKDGPLVKCISRLINKADTVLREVKSQCTAEMLGVFGEDWMTETNEKFSKDLSNILQDLSPCIEHAKLRDSANNTMESNVKKTNGFRATKSFAKPAAHPLTQPEVPNKTQNYSHLQTSPPLQGGRPNDDNGKAHGEKHVTFIPTQEKPEQPPFEKPHFKEHNYLNLPQFTGVGAHVAPSFQQEVPPMRVVPTAETIYLAQRH